MLAAHGVDFVGLWWGVPGGPHDLDRDRWRELAQAAAATKALTPVLVTFAKDADELRATIEGSRCDGSSSTVSDPRDDSQDQGNRGGRGSSPRDQGPVRTGGECVEAPLLASYEKAGVDVFLFDVVSEDGRVGSTGQAIDPAVVAPLADKLSRPFLLAGGISAANRRTTNRSRPILDSSGSMSIPTHAPQMGRSHLRMSRRSAGSGSSRPRW